MCGIVGFTGKRNCVPFLLEGLKGLEYRGYDSAGIALLNDSGAIDVVKKVGRISVLERSVDAVSGSCGIGHTRWATHGRPSDDNSHPHRCGRFTLVHNGIIENFLELKIELVNEGAVFSSQTDSEVVAHLLHKFYDGDFISTLKKVTEYLRGSYALAVICEDFPGKIAVAKKDNPLVIGLSDKENYVASDMLAVARYTDRAYVLSDGEFALVDDESVVVFDRHLNCVDKQEVSTGLDKESIGLGSHESFMLKEIGEIPLSIKNTCGYYINNGMPDGFINDLARAEKVTIVACGTAYHAGICGKYIMEKLCRIPVEVEIASEYRYKDPIINDKTFVIAVSQSGETADTLAALKLAKAGGAVTACITNVATSSIVTHARYYLPMLAGPEVAVAATKSYNSQLCVLYMVALSAAEHIRHIDVSGYYDMIKELPALAEKTIKRCNYLNVYAGRLSQVRSVFFLGRGLDYAVALEGSLKLKEISYVHSEGYPAGELKHGTLALIEKNTLVVTIITQQALAEKTMNALHEVKAREADILMLSQIADPNMQAQADTVITLPQTDDLFMPILSIIPLQLFAYYMARARGNDPDKPRNLAKSVTVE